MVCVIFGMFNIITAIFVEATMNGLKENANEKNLGLERQPHVRQSACPCAIEWKQVGSTAT